MGLKFSKRKNSESQIKSQDVKPKYRLIACYGKHVNVDTVTGEILWNIDIGSRHYSFSSGDYDLFKIDSPLRYRVALTYANDRVYGKILDIIDGKDHIQHVADDIPSEPAPDYESIVPYQEGQPVHNNNA